MPGNGEGIGDSPGTACATVAGGETADDHCIAREARRRAAFQLSAEPLNWHLGTGAPTLSQDKGTVMAVAVEEPKAVVLRDDDNVAVAARPIPRGFALDAGGGAGEGPRAPRGGPQGAPARHSAGGAPGQDRGENRLPP